MTREEWLDIASRCEKATGHDRGIDFDISKAATGHAGFTPYTASVDAIAELIDWELPGFSWECRRSGIGDPGQALIWNPMTQPGMSEWEHWRVTGCSNPALALCAAFARAMADKALSRNDQEKDAG